jgi:hypothetical protein
VIEEDLLADLDYLESCLDETRNAILKVIELANAKLDAEEVDRLRAKKKQIYEDLKSEQTHNTKGELTYDPEGEEHMKAGTIEVTDYVEHEDGSATLVVDTDKDATRLLVEVGLRRLLEMAVNQEDGYEFTSETKEDLAEATEGSVQEEMG